MGKLQECQKTLSVCGACGALKKKVQVHDVHASFNP